MWSEERGGDEAVRASDRHRVRLGYALFRIFARRVSMFIVRTYYAQAYAHFVWAVQDRRPLLVGDIRREAYRLIGSEAVGLTCDILALGGTDDHVHLAVRLGVTASAAEIMKRVKGVSSHCLREGNTALDFRWQKGYGFFTYSNRDRPAIQRYIAMQEQRHGANRLWPTLERIEMD